MITRSEFYVKPDRAPVRRTPPRLLWDFALGVAALAYVLLALFDEVYSPAMALAIVILIAYGLVSRRKRQQS